MNPWPCYQLPATFGTAALQTRAHGSHPVDARTQDPLCQVMHELRMKVAPAVPPHWRTPPRDTQQTLGDGSPTGLTGHVCFGWPGTCAGARSHLEGERMSGTLWPLGDPCDALPQAGATLSDQRARSRATSGFCRKNPLAQLLAQRVARAEVGCHMTLPL